MILENENQHHIELMGLITNLQNWKPNISAPRLGMFGKQLPQALVVDGCTRDRFYVGTEVEYGKYTFKVKAMYPFEIIGLVEKFKVGIGFTSLKYNPRFTYLVRRTDGNREYDVIHLDRFCTHHNNFGFEYRLNMDVIRKAQVGKRIDPGEVFAQSPTLDEEGTWRYGVLTTTANLSTAFVTEDGFMASTEWCQQMRSKGTGTITVTVPKDHYLLNVNGDENHIKLFPGPGEPIREDGLVMAMRRYDDILGGVELSPREMMEVDYDFDEKVYIEAHTQNARVIDVEIWEPDGDATQRQPVYYDRDGLVQEDTIKRFSKAQTEYYDNILKVYKDIVRTSRQERREIKVTKRLQRLLRYATGVCKEIPFGQSFRTTLMRNGVALNQTQITIRYTYDVIPTIGYKFTGKWGDKGVLCKIKPRAEMPTDQYGIVADLVRAPNITINRMNPPVLFEQHYNFVAMRIEEQIREIIRENGPTPTAYKQAYELALAFYKPVSPLFYEKCIQYMGWNDPRHHKRHVDSIIEKGVYIWLPPITQNIGIEGTAELEDAFPAIYGPVTFVDDEGKLRRTKDKVMIGANYIIALEKTGHDWSAVDAPRRQVHGVPSKMSQRDRFQLPWRFQSIRFFGESEVRSYSGIIGGEWVADMLDRDNNPEVQYQIYRKIVASETPTDLEFVIDRAVYPIGNSLSLGYMNNHLYCAGAEFNYIDVDNYNAANDLSLDRTLARQLAAEEEEEDYEEQEEEETDETEEEEVELDDDSDEDE